MCEKSLVWAGWLADRLAEKDEDPGPLLKGSVTGVYLPWRSRCPGPVGRGPALCYQSNTGANHPIFFVCETTSFESYGVHCTVTRVSAGSLARQSDTSQTSRQLSPLCRLETEMQ